MSDGPQTTRREEMAARHDAGETFAEIGRRYGISGARVQQIVHGRYHAARTVRDALRKLVKRGHAQKVVVDGRVKYELTEAGRKAAEKLEALRHAK